MKLKIEIQTAWLRYGTIWRRLNTSKKTKRASRKKKVNTVVGQCSLPQTIFAYDGNRNLCVLTEKLSGCELQIAHLKGTTART